MTRDPKGGPSTSTSSGPDPEVDVSLPGPFALESPRSGLAPERPEEHNLLISREPLHLRAADADRERTADLLGRRCAEGRLSPDELSQRLEIVYAALTYGELAAVVSDLPGDPPVRYSRDRPMAPRALTVAAATLCAMLVVALPLYGVSEALAASPVATLAVLGVLAVFAALIVAILASLLVAVAPVAAVALGAVWLGRHLGDRRERGLTR